MEDYWKEKIIAEYANLQNLWSALSGDWKNPGEDHENLYRFRVPLNIVAFLCRRVMEQTYLAHKENKQYTNKYKEIKVRILKDGSAKNAFYKEIRSMQYSDTFKNKIETQKELYEICNYIIHERSSSYADDMISYDENANTLKKSSMDTSFFYHIETHNLRIRFNKHRCISWFVQWSGEKPGAVLIDI